MFLFPIVGGDLSLILYSTTTSFRDGKATLDAGEHLLPGIYYLLLKDTVGNVYTMRYVKE